MPGLDQASCQACPILSPAGGKPLTNCDKRPASVDPGIVVELGGEIFIAARSVWVPRGGFGSVQKFGKILRSGRICGCSAWSTLIWERIIQDELLGKW